MKIRELTQDQILSVACPTCGVSPKGKCKLVTGQPRNAPHRDRRLKAMDAATGESLRAKASRQDLESALSLG